MALTWRLRSISLRQSLWMVWPQGSTAVGRTLSNRYSKHTGQFWRMLFSTHTWLPWRMHAHRRPQRSALRKCMHAIALHSVCLACRCCPGEPNSAACIAAAACRRHVTSAI